MNARERVLNRERQRGRSAAQEVQTKAPEMTGSELYSVADRIPRFSVALRIKNMLERPVGFVCVAPSGRLVRLIQPYDSSIYTQDPEELPAHWGFVWSKNPANALPFIALSTAPYYKGDCCTENGKIYASLYDGNVNPPSLWKNGWEEVTE
jgi:hypothetical protein